MGEPKKVICPVCTVPVLPQTNGWTDDDGTWNKDCTDCPICGYVFTPNELK
jgi:hypothetical protein